jgi:hypothetical protein
MWYRGQSSCEKSMPSLNRIIYLLKHPDLLKTRLQARRKNRELSRMQTALFTEWQQQHSKKLERFRNIHQGEKCFIIGNGPSLNQMDLSRLNEHICFGLNKIYLLFERTGLSIDYHVAVNPLVIEQSHDEFTRLGCPSFLSFSASRGLFDAFDDLYYLFSSSHNKFHADITGGIREGYTVTNVALQIAYFMGFKEVYLIGVDHNFTVKGMPNEKQLLTGPDLNHFDPDYFGGQEWHLPDLYKSEQAYRMARTFYLQDKREIFDATVGGKLDIFKKISYEEALRRCADHG